MKNTLHLSIYDTAHISNIAKALSSEQRIKILKLLDNNVLNISEIASRLQMPMSSAALHIKILEESGLVITQPVPGIRGSQKLSGIKVDHLSIDLKPSYNVDSPYQTAYFSMPIGNYFDFRITPPCGIVSESRYLGATDDVSAFFLPDHSTAQLIWFTQGYLEYRFNNQLIKSSKTVEGIEFSFEACSEAQGYNNEWPSDITLWVGGKEVGTFTSKGDFGGVRGYQNPIWWSDTLTQYGVLHRLFIDRSGCYIDEIKTSDQTLESLKLTQSDFLLFRIGIKPEAKYVGGLNLFGEYFGNFSQHINMKIDYTPMTP